MLCTLHKMCPLKLKSFTQRPSFSEGAQFDSLCKALVIKSAVCVVLLASRLWATVAPQDQAEILGAL